MKKLHIASLVLAVLVGATTAQGANMYWHPAGNGTFLVDSNWRDGNGDSTVTPGASDIAYLGRLSTTHTQDYTISLGANHTVGRVYTSTGASLAVTLDLGGNTLDVGAATTFALRMEGYGTDPRTLNLTNGTLDVTDGGLLLNYNSATTNNTAGTARLIVGDGATLNFSRGGGAASETAERLIVGSYAPGELRIESGGRVYAGTPQAILASYIGDKGNGALYIDGTGEFEFDRTTTRNYMTLGNEGSKGTLEITNGGTLKGAYITRFAGLSVAGSATVLITGTRSDGEGGEIGSSLTTDRLNIGFSNATADRTATVRVADGGVLSVTRSLDDTVIAGLSTVEIDGGKIEVAGATVWNAGTTYKLTLHGSSDTPFSAGGASTLALTGDGVTFELSLADGLKPKVDDVFTVLDYSGGSLAGTFAGLLDGATIVDSQTGAEFELFYNYNSEDRIALVTTIPEPHSLGLILLGLGGLAYHRRRRA